MELSNYLLYNFEDEPSELYYRMKINVDFFDKLGVTKGKMDKGVDFFEEAFGRNLDEFYKILWMPETFIYIGENMIKTLGSALLIDTKLAQRKIVIWQTNSGINFMRCRTKNLKKLNQ